MKSISNENISDYINEKINQWLRSSNNDD